MELTPDDLREMAKAMDIHGDDRIPTAPVLAFLREEAMAASKSGALALSKVSSCFSHLFQSVFYEKGQSHSVRVCILEGVLRKGVNYLMLGFVKRTHGTVRLASIHFRVSRG